MKKCGHCPDYMSIPMDGPSMLEMDGIRYGEPLATIFVHRQPENSAMYSVCEAFENGTVYPALNMPYEGPFCCKPGGDLHG